MISHTHQILHAGNGTEGNLFTIIHGLRNDRDIIYQPFGNILALFIKFHINGDVVPCISFNDNSLTHHRISLAGDETKQFIIGSTIFGTIFGSTGRNLKVKFMTVVIINKTSHAGTIVHTQFRNKHTPLIPSGIIHFVGIHLKAVSVCPHMLFSRTGIDTYTLTVFTSFIIYQSNGIRSIIQTGKIYTFKAVKIILVTFLLSFLLHGYIQLFCSFGRYCHYCTTCSSLILISMESKCSVTHALHRSHGKP